MPSEQVIQTARAKNLFTSETAKVMQAKGTSTKKSALKLQKYLAKLGIEEHYIEAFLKGLASPVVAGVSMYLLLMLLERLTNSVYSANQSAAQQNAQNQTTNILNLITSSLPPGISQAFGFGASIGAATGSPNPFALDFVALKAAVIIYITTGGNIAGLLGTATNLFGALTK
jgi:hypothetical protein